jgi:hypothetical protein
MMEENQSQLTGQGIPGTVPKSVGDDRMDVTGQHEERKASLHTKVGSEHCIG